MWRLALRIAARLAREGARFKKEASAPDSPGGRTIVREEWILFIPTIISIFADSVGLPTEDVAGAFLESASSMVDANDEDTYTF